MEKFSQDKINNLPGLNVIFVTGEGCASCVSMVKVVNEVSQSFKDVNFYILDADESYLDFLRSHNVRTIPSILIIKDNKLIDMCHGYQPEEILEIWLDMKIKDDINK